MNWKKFFNRWLFCLPMVVLAGCFDGQPLEPLKMGDTAPPFSLTLLNGERKTREDYRNKGLVMTFMASWCPCSNDSLPMFQAAYERHKDHVSFLMIGIQEAESNFKGFVEKHSIMYEAGYDSSKIARTYGVNAPPTTVFLDKKGQVTQFFYGNIKDRQQDFARWVEEVSL